MVERGDPLNHHSHFIHRFTLNIFNFSDFRLACNYRIVEESNGWRLVREIIENDFYKLAHLISIATSIRC